MIGERSVPEVQVPKELGIMDTRVVLDVTVDPAPGEIVQEFVPLQPRVEREQQTEEREPANLSGDDERKPPELRR